MSDSRNSPPVQGATAAAPPNPKYVVDDSPVKAGIITFMSLLFFGLSLAAAILRYASARDLNGIRELMMEQSTINWLSAVATALAPPAWLAWRTFKAWWHKHREVEIVEKAPPEVAMTKTQLFEATFAPVEDFPPTRARETTMPSTRLVDRSVLHRAAPSAAYADMDRFAFNDGAFEIARESVPRTPPSKPLENMVDVEDLLRGAGIDSTAPYDPVLSVGVAPAAASPEPRPANSPSFDQLHERFVQEGSQGAFSDYLRDNGWDWNSDTKRWEEKDA